MQITDLPQLVALFHSFVGLAAVLTSLANYMVSFAHLHNDPAEVIHRLAIFLGIFTGGITFTGSLIAFAKLQGLLPSTAKYIPMHNLANAGMGIGSLALAAYFLHSHSYLGGIGALLGATAFSKILGVTLTNAIGKLGFLRVRWG